MENTNSAAVKQKEPLTRQEKIKRILLIAISAAVILVIIGGLIFGSPYSIKKNNYSSFEAMITEHYDRPTVLMMSKKSCPYCQKVYPGISELKDQYKDVVNFYWIDIHDGGEGTELYRKYRPQAGIGTDGVPTVHYFYARSSADATFAKYRTVTGWGGSGDNNSKGQIEEIIKTLLEYGAQ